MFMVEGRQVGVPILQTSQGSRFAAVGQPLRLAGSPLPLYRADAAIQGKTLQRFRLLIMMHSCIDHGTTCLYRRRSGCTRVTLPHFQSLDYKAQLHCAWDDVVDSD